jgi:hypothetical protein
MKKEFKWTIKEVLERVLFIAILFAAAFWIARDPKNEKYK